LLSPNDDGIVVVEVGRDAAMDVDTVPEALRARLGPAATAGLLEALDEAGREWKADVTSLAVDRFDRRLVEEASGLRQEITKADAGLRQELTTVAAGLRQELTTVAAGLRQQISTLEAGLRQETTTLAASLRQEMAGVEVRLHRELADMRFDLLKWSFLFWIGQVVAITAIMGVMLRAL
jgi:very-short-patch-repair endonuclease